MINKRKTLKRIMGVGSVATLAPYAWIKPIVSSVVLPAHAQTSPTGVTVLGSGRLQRDVDDVPGTDIDIEFVTGSVRLSNDMVFLNVQFSADVTRGNDANFFPTIDFSDIRSDDGESIRVGTSGIPPQICGDPGATPLATFITGNNDIEIRYPISSGKRYTAIQLAIYPGFCAPDFFGNIEFEIDIQS